MVGRQPVNVSRDLLVPIIVVCVAVSLVIVLTRALPYLSSGAGGELSLVGLRVFPGIPLDSEDVTVWLDVEGDVQVEEIGFYIDGVLRQTALPRSSSISANYTLGALTAGVAVLDVVVKGSNLVTTAHREIRVLPEMDVVRGLSSGVILTPWLEREQDLVWEEPQYTSWIDGLSQTELPFWDLFGALERAREKGTPVVGCWLCGYSRSFVGSGGPIIVHVDLENNTKYTLDIRKAIGMNRAFCVAANWTGQVLVGGDGIARFDTETFTWDYFPVGSPGILGTVATLGFDLEGHLWAGGYVDEYGSESSQGWISVLEDGSWKSWTEMRTISPSGFRPLPPLNDLAFDHEGNPMLATQEGLVRYNEYSGDFVEIDSSTRIYIYGELEEAPASEIFYLSQRRPWLICPFPGTFDTISYDEGYCEAFLLTQGCDQLHWVHEGLGRVWVGGGMCIYAYDAARGTWKSGYVRSGHHCFVFDYADGLYFTGAESLFRFDYGTYGDKYLSDMLFKPLTHAAGALVETVPESILLATILTPLSVMLILSRMRQQPNHR